MPSTRNSSNRSISLHKTIHAADALTNSYEEHKRYQYKVIEKDEVVCTYRIKFYLSSTFTNNLLEACMKLFELNMSELYSHSSWGLDLESKRQELSHDKARYLIVSEENRLKNVDTTMQQQQNNSHKIIGFAHFRFDVNCYNFPTDAVLYIYEIQVRKEHAGCGVGKRLMALMELMAKRSNVKKLMLTVFKDNTKAMGFYLNKLNYNFDVTSPRNEDYVILSKEI